MLSPLNAVKCNGLLKKDANNVFKLSSKKKNHHTHLNKSMFAMLKSTHLQQRKKVQFYPKIINTISRPYCSTAKTEMT